MTRTPTPTPTQALSPNPTTHPSPLTPQHSALKPHPHQVLRGASLSSSLSSEESRLLSGSSNQLSAAGVGGGGAYMDNPLVATLKVSTLREYYLSTQ